MTQIQAVVGRPRNRSASRSLSHWDSVISARQFDWAICLFRVETSTICTLNSRNGFTWTLGIQEEIR